MRYPLFISLVAMTIAVFLLAPLGAQVMELTEALPEAQTPDIESELMKAGQGSLLVVDETGEIKQFPLKHTSVFASISGFIAEVEVQQEYENPFESKIEAVYVFPLPENAAVHDMLMTIGDRNVYAEIRERERARAMYELARAQGKRTALLEQERPNIFTQSVANIQPGEKITITIRFLQPLKYDRGTYRYVFPMVVGPRFIPGGATGKEGTGWAPDTTDVPDASRITPPVLKPGVRNGHDISLEVHLDAGLEIANLRSVSHKVEKEMVTKSSAIVSIIPEDSIPNKDFVLEYDVAGDKPRMALLTHKSQWGGYFMLMLQPAYDDVAEVVEPKEMFFVLDCSGSMRGFPIEKSKEAMFLAINGLGPDDSFQVIRFSSSASAFSPEPLPATRENKEKALEYIDGLNGTGGTMMIEGIKACLDYPKQEGRERIVFFLTDGQIGNDDQILAAIKEKVGDTKLFSYGIGSSTNRSLLERMAELGNGTCSFIRQDEPAEGAIKAMLTRVKKPFMQNVTIDWGGLGVQDVYPKAAPYLYSAQPLILYGRFVNPADGIIKLKGSVKGVNYEEQVRVTLPLEQPENPCLAKIWAREKIRSLMLESLGKPKSEEYRQQVTDLALEFHLMSQYTSLVAVDEEIPAGSDELPLVTIPVPVPMPEGVSFEGVFGNAAMGTGVGVAYVDRVDLADHCSEAFQLSSPVGNGPSGRSMVYSTTRDSRKDILAIDSILAAQEESNFSLFYVTPSGSPGPTGDLGQYKYSTQLKRARMKELLVMADDEWARLPADVSLGKAYGEGLSRLMIDSPLDAALSEGFKKYVEDNPDEEKAYADYCSAEKTTDEAFNRKVAELLSSKDNSRILLGLLYVQKGVSKKQSLSEENLKALVSVALKAEKESIRSQALVILHAADSENVFATCKSALGDESASVRLTALKVILAATDELPLDILARTSRDKDLSVRLLTIAALGDPELDGRAGRIITAMVSDEDQLISALAIRTGAEIRKDTKLVPALSDILLKADPEKRYMAILNAATGLRALSLVEDGPKAEVQKALAKSLSREYPTEVGESKFDLRSAVQLLALGALEDYKAADALPDLRKIAANTPNQGVKMLANLVLTNYTETAKDIFKSLSSDEKLVLGSPEYAAGMFARIARSGIAGDMTEYARTMLEGEKLSGQKYDELRLVLVEILSKSTKDGDREYAASLLKTDRYWKVRRAVLVNLIGKGGKDVYANAVYGLNDTNYVVKKIALAAAIAYTAEEGKSAAYLEALGKTPSIKTADGIIAAEGFDSSISIKPKTDIMKVLSKRTEGI